jgi:hypothetical protein
MTIKDGDTLELRLNSAHGNRWFGVDVAENEVGEHRDWAVLRVARAGKHRGVEERVYFEVEMPIAELGRLIAGQSARGAAHWTVDSAKTRGKARMAKAKVRR